MTTHRALPSLPGAQRGAVLIIALILLAVMTLLAVAAMNMNSMEEHMSYNVQEINRVFQGAESGLSMAMADGNAYDTNNAFASSTTSVGGANVAYNTQYISCFKPARGATTWGQGAVDYYYFYVRATAVNVNNINAAHVAYAYRVAAASGEC